MFRVVVRSVQHGDLREVVQHLKVPLTRDPYWHIRGLPPRHGEVSHITRLPCAGSVSGSGGEDWESHAR